MLSSYGKFYKRFFFSIHHPFSEAIVIQLATVVAVIITRPEKIELVMIHVQIDHYRNALIMTGHAIRRKKP